MLLSSLLCAPPQLCAGTSGLPGRLLTHPLRPSSPLNLRSPTDSHLVAFGCANYRVYVHDLRQPREALGTIAGPQRAVSYVRFMGGTHLVAASTDSTLRWGLFDLK